MNSNIVIIIIGCILIVLPLFFLAKDGNKEEEDYNSEILTALSQSKSRNDWDDLQQQQLLKAFEEIKNEIKSMKMEIEGISNFLDSGQVATEEEVTSAAPVRDWENFDQSLNYNVFIQKNSDIIALSKAGKSVEEIARHLNKSLREVEMVIKLIK